MKFVWIFMMVGLVSASAKSYSQAERFDLKMENSTLKSILHEIEEKTEFYFFYNDADVREIDELTIDINRKTIAEALDVLLKDKGFKYEFHDRYVMLKKEDADGKATAKAIQQKSVSGRVTDTYGQPLPGVTVVVKGTTKGTVSDVDGKFSFSDVKNDATLVFSFIGMRTQEIALEGKAFIGVEMEEAAIGIEEVVAVAYGTQKKSHLSAAVQSIKAEVLENRPISTVSEALAGQVAGLNVRMPSGAPESAPNLNIRGFTGLGLNSKGNLEAKTAEPLVLIDGVERPMSDINPNDIETISVLKDGASTAIYGSRAPYGVVLIKTKSGRKGESMRVQLTSNLGLASPTHVPEFMESYEWGEMLNVFLRNNHNGNRNGYFSDLTLDRMRAYAAGDYGNEVFADLDPAYVPFGVYPENAKNWAGNSRAFGNTKWLKEALKSTVPSQQHNVSVSGGSETTTYYASFGYNQRNGIFKGINDHKDRYSSLLRVNTDVTKWFNFNMSANYVRTEEEGPTVWGAGRNYGKAYELLARAFPNHVPTTPLGGNYRFSILPNMNGESGNESVKRDDVTITGGVVVKPFKGFNVHANYTWRKNNYHFRQLNYVVQQVLVTGQVVKSQRTGGKNSIIRRLSQNDYQTFDVYADYSKEIGKHRFYALAGVQQEENNYLKMEGTGADFYSKSIPALASVSGEKNVFDDINEWATRGYYGRFTYNYAEKYFLEFNMRRDATSRFRAEDRWATFPSVSGAWNIAKENFWKWKDQISLLKLRGSWASAGDGNVSRLGDYPFYPSLETKVYESKHGNAVIIDGELVPYINMPQIVANTLTWAKPTTIDIAIDIAAFNNRLNMTYDWYQRTIRDQFGPPAVLPEVLGTKVPLSNNSETETRGWEFEVEWRDKAADVLGKPLNYSVGFNLSDYIGYVVDFQDDGTGSRGQWAPGMVFGQNYHFRSNGIAQSTADVYNNVMRDGKWYYAGDLMCADLNGDGQINKGEGESWYAMGDLEKNGFSYPRKTFGINLGLNWNNFDLAVYLDGVGKWTKYSSHHYVFGYGGDKWWSPFYKENMELGYWTPENTNAFYARPQEQRKNSGWENDQYALNLAHLRIRNVKLGYRFPQLIKGVKSIYTYVSAENLGFIYQKSFVKYDPDLLSSSNGQGYPPMRNISFGLNVEF